MKFSEEHEAFRAAVRDMAQAHIAPIANEVDRTGEFPAHLVPLFGDMGLIQLSVPEEYGGPGGDLVSACIAREEIARAGSMALAQLANQNGIVVNALLAGGSDDLKSRVLSRLADGRTLTCIAITEPGAGSDPTLMTTRAVRDGDDWVINGAKQFITWGSDAHLAVVFARTSGATGKAGISAFVVDTDQPGWVVSKAHHKMGQRGVSNNDIFLDDVRVPHANMLGEEGSGFRVAMRALHLNRLTVSAMAVGAAECAHAYAISYAKERFVGDRRVSDFQGIRWIIADDHTQIAAARHLVYDAAFAHEDGVDPSTVARLSSMAKLFAGEMVNQVTANAVQILGGAGYMTEHPVERYLRDAKLIAIYEGTSQIQKNIIAQRLVG